MSDYLVRMKESKFMMIPRLPDEVLGDILSRLPVKSLLRFRSASKSWRSLIDSSHFVKLHLNRSIESRTNLSVLLMSKHHQVIGFDSVDRFTDSGNLVRQPLTCGWDGSVTVCGSCNGLFCLSWLGEDGTEVVLWNPATRESRKLPEFWCRSTTKKPFSSGETCTTYGFGYDSTNDDYKVVSLLYLCSFEETGWHFHDEIDVYSFNSNSWHRTIVECPNNSDVHLGHVLVNGALHWTVSEQGIVAFDVGLERFLEVPHPPSTDYSSGENISKRLVDLGGCLSVFFHHLGEGSHVDIWVMKEYGVKDSWTKLITVTARELGYSRVPAVPYLRPIACSMSGGGILFQRNSRDLLWYEVERKTIKKIKGRGLVTIVYGYTESLVSLNVVGGAQGEGDGNMNEQQEDDGL